MCWNIFLCALQVNKVNNRKTTLKPGRSITRNKVSLKASSGTTVSEIIKWVMLKCALFLNIISLSVKRKKEMDDLISIRLSKVLFIFC